MASAAPRLGSIDANGGQPDLPSLLKQHLAIKDPTASYYRILGIDEFEENADLINTAVIGRLNQLHVKQLVPGVQALKEYIGQIGAVLLDEEKKTAYDARLRKSQEAAAIEHNARQHIAQVLPHPDIIPFRQPVASPIPPVQPRFVAPAMPIAQPALEQAPVTVPRASKKPAPKKTNVAAYAAAIGGGLLAITGLATTAYVALSGGKKEDTTTPKAPAKAPQHPGSIVTASAAGLLPRTKQETSEDAAAHEEDIRRFSEGRTSHEKAQIEEILRAAGPRVAAEEQAFRNETLATQSGKSPTVAPAKGRFDEPPPKKQPTTLMPVHEMKQEDQVAMEASGQRTETTRATEPEKPIYVHRDAVWNAETGSWYKVLPDAMSYTDAAALAARNSATLAIPDSAKENAYLLNLVGQDQDQWLGLTKGPDGKLHQPNGELASYENWMSGEGKTAGEKYVRTIGSAGGLWADYYPESKVRVCLEWKATALPKASQSQGQKSAAKTVGTEVKPEEKPQVVIDQADFQRLRESMLKSVENKSPKEKILTLIDYLKNPEILKNNAATKAVIAEIYGLSSKSGDMEHALTAITEMENRPEMFDGGILGACLMQLKTKAQESGNRMLYFMLLDKLEKLKDGGMDPKAVLDEKIAFLKKRTATVDFKKRGNEMERQEVVDTILSLAITSAYLDEEKSEELIKTATASIGAQPDASVRKAIDEKVTAAQHAVRDAKEMESIALALKGDPKNPSALAKRGEIYFSQGKVQEGLSDLAESNSTLSSLAQHTQKELNAPIASGAESFALAEDWKNAAAKSLNGNKRAKEQLARTLYERASTATKNPLDPFQKTAVEKIVGELAKVESNGGTDVISKPEAGMKEPMRPKYVPKEAIWNKETGSWYLMLPEKISFLQASRIASQNSGSIVIIDSKEENEFVQKMGTGENQWLGVAKRNGQSPKLFKPDGTPVTFYNWARDEGTNERELLVQMSPDGTWADYPEGSARACLEWKAVGALGKVETNSGTDVIGKSETATKEPMRPKYVPKEAMWSSETKCWYLLGNEMDFAAAVQFAASMNAQIVTIESKQEDDVVTGLAMGKSIYLGITKNPRNKTWYKLNGKEITFENWADGEGKNDSELAAEKRADGYWADIPVSHKKYVMYKWLSNK